MYENKPIRVIKRYPNRRLYDIDSSRYVNLSDLRQLVLDGVRFQVLVEKTQEDQTKNVLMQIFLELEMSGQPIFSDQSLRNLIVMNSTMSNDVTESYLSRLFNFLNLSSISFKWNTHKHIYILVLFVK